MSKCTNTKQQVNDTATFAEEEEVKISPEDEGSLSKSSSSKRKLEEI
jgi:hypothetical protein